jgi:hypothetical protein
MKVHMSKMRLNFVHMTVFTLCILGMLPNVGFSDQVTEKFPEKIDTTAEYLFFLHNYYVETNGPDGNCQYKNILKMFSDEGYIVISEIRSGKIVPCTYAKKVAEQVKTLLEAGVPPMNIIVAGHSKGAVIALCVASQLANPEVNYVIMAGCEIAGIKKYNMYPDFNTLKGQMLSIYAISDSIANSCDPTFSISPSGLVYNEVILESDAGHQLFFKSEDIWTKPTISWLKRSNR